jgi:hypothetical protein
MNCAVCGKDNQPGTRFCVHCGAALAGPRPAAGTPTPATAAAPAPASAPPTRPAVAAAPPVETTVRTMASPPPPPPVDDDMSTRAIPAYGVAGAEGSGVAAKILLGLGISALVIAAGFVGYKIFGGSADVKDSLAGYGARPPARETAAPPAPVAPVVPPPQEVPKVEEKAVIEPPEPPKPEPPKADVAKATADEKAKALQSRAEAKAPPKAPSTTVPAPAAPPVSPPAAAPARPAAPTPQAPASPTLDRWEMMAAEQRHCRTENMFNRVICDQRVRLKFCDGYWGAVPQCPGAVINPDKGQ